MLAYMVGLLYQINTGLESVLELCLIVVALQSMFHYWLFRLADQPAVLQESIIDLEVGNTIRSNTFEAMVLENMEAQGQQRMQTEDQQNQISEQILPSTATQQDDDQNECIKTALKVSIGIGSLTGSMIGVLAGNGHKKSESIFLKVGNMLLWASFVLSVILMVLTLLSIKNKQLVVIVKIAMYATIVSLILSVVDLSIVYITSGNL